MSDLARVAVCAIAWRFGGQEMMGFIAVPAFLAGAVNLGNVWLTKHQG